MKRVSISWKSAQDLYSELTGHASMGDFESERLIGELRTQLDKKPKPKKALPFKTRKQTKAKKDRSKKEETAEIRAAVMKRADNRCECGCGLQFSGERWASFGNEAELDHMFGRGRVKQSVRNTWALTRHCHRNKTRNYPSPQHWLQLFAEHCNRHGYAQEEARADTLLSKHQAKAELSAGVSNG